MLPRAIIHRVAQTAVLANCNGSYGRSDMRQRIRQGLLILFTSIVLVMVVSVFGVATIWWNDGELPELAGQIGAFQIIAHTTVAPTCMPVISCAQQFANVPLPHYYVVWVIIHGDTNTIGTRILTIPLRLPFTL